MAISKTFKMNYKVRNIRLAGHKWNCWGVNYLGRLVVITFKYKRYHWSKKKRPSGKDFPFLIFKISSFSLLMQSIGFVIGEQI